MQMGRWKHRQFESLFNVTKLLNEVCLNVSNAADLGGKEEQQREGKQPGRGGGDQSRGAAKSRKVALGLEYLQGLSARGMSQHVCDLP